MWEFLLEDCFTIDERCLYRMKIKCWNICISMLIQNPPGFFVSLQLRFVFNYYITSRWSFKLLWKRKAVYGLLTLSKYYCLSTNKCNYADTDPPKASCILRAELPSCSLVYFFSFELLIVQLCSTHLLLFNSCFRSRTITLQED